MKRPIEKVLRAEIPKGTSLLDIARILSYNKPKSVLHFIEELYSDRQEVVASYRNQYEEWRRKNIKESLCHYRESHKSPYKYLYKVRNGVRKTYKRRY